jgi:hypothetical protein
MNLQSRQYPSDYFASLDESTIERLMMLGIIVIGIVAVVALVTFNKRK